MKVLLIGTGGVGEALAKIAHARCSVSPWLDLMVLSDYDEERVRTVAGQIGDPEHFPAEKINARNKDEIVALIRKYNVDLVMNACDPSFNEIIFDTALECGIHYMDMALSLSKPDPVDPFHKAYVKSGDYQFARDDAWRKSGKMALLGMGIDPGASNIFARYAEKYFFDEIDEVGIKDGNNLTADGYDITFGFSIWTTIDECLNPPFIWEKEKGWYTTEPFSEKETFVFPDGIGEQEVVNVEHEEVLMLPRYIGKGCKKVTFKYSLGDKFITMLKDLQALGLSDKKSKVPGTSFSPRDIVAKVAPSPVEIADKLHGKCCVGAYVAGRKDGLERRVFIYQTVDNQDMMRRFGSQAVVAQTAFNPVIAMELMAKGLWTHKGVICPEGLNPDPYLTLMDEYGFYAGIQEMDSEYRRRINKENLYQVMTGEAGSARYFPDVQMTAAPF